GGMGAGQQAQRQSRGRQQGEHDSSQGSTPSNQGLRMGTEDKPGHGTVPSPPGRASARHGDTRRGTVQPSEIGTEIELEALDLVAPLVAEGLRDADREHAEW